MVYPAMTISESVTGEILGGTVLNVGAIATIQVDFTSNHGLLPGSSILTQITSQPAPAFSGASRALPNNLNWSSVAFGNGTFVAVASNSAVTATSNDGRTWIAGGSLSGTGWSGIAAGLIGETMYFVAIASGGNTAFSSTNGGANWTTMGVLPGAGSWSSVTYFNGFFIAVRSGSNQAAYSTDGITWTASTLPSSATWSDVAGGVIGTSNYIVAIASGGTASAYSVDNGINWTTMGALPATATWSSIAYGNSRFVAISSGGTAAAVSINGTTWISVTLPASSTWNSITFGDDVFVAHDSANRLITSFNGTTGSWTEQTLPVNAAWEEIAYGNYSGLGEFVIVGPGLQALEVVLTSANHNLSAGPFVITQVPTRTSLRFPARTTGTINTTAAPLTGIVYALSLIHI